MAKNQKKNNTGPKEDFLGPLTNIDEQQAETPTRENPPMQKDSGLTEAAANGSIYDSDGNFMPLEGIPFMDMENEGDTFEGVFIGQGASLKTKNSRDEAFDTFVFLDKKDSSYKRIPVGAVLKKIAEKFNPGEALIRITFKGKRKGDKGNTYNDYQVEAKQLKTPLVAGKHWDPDFIIKQH